MKRRRFLQQTASISVAGLALCEARATTQDDSWLDPRRNRSLALRMRWPEGDSPCSLIVHSHGLGGGRDGGDVWGRAWQQAGFAVLHLQHPGSDTEVLRSGMRALRAAASAEHLLARVLDMQFALDEATRHSRLGEAVWSRVRLDAIGASGHSFGAVTVQAVAGQRFGRPTPGLVEPRFKAFVAFSPSPGQGRGAAEAFAGVTRPFLAVTGSHDGDVLGHGLTTADRARVYDDLTPGRRALLWLDGADHMTFAGNGEQPLRARIGPLKREAGADDVELQHHARVATVTTLWWRAQLLGDAEAASALRAPPGLGAKDRWRQD